LSVEAGTGWTACLAVVQTLRQEFISALVVCRVVSGEIYDFEVNEHIKIRHTGGDIKYVSADILFSVTRR
jgi:hypothetical protein